MDARHEAWRERNRERYWEIFWQTAGISDLHRERLGEAMDRREGVLSKAIERTIQFARRRPLQGGLYVFGPVGCGKTLLASKLVHLVAHDVAGQYDQADIGWDSERQPPTMRISSTPELLARIRSSFGTEGQTASAIVDEYKFLDLLVLDDIGTEKPTEWVREVLFQVIDWRYGQQKPTVYTSNYSLMELSDRLGERIADRIMEMCRGGIVKINAGSYRG